MKTNLQNTLSSFISEELLRIDEPVGEDENLLSDGMVDSLGMLRLVGFIEETFALKVPPEDFVVENFRTLTILSDYLQRNLENGSDG